MDNYQIADTLNLLSKLMDIHGENSFKSKSYSSAAFAIEKIQVPLSELTTEKIAAIRGVGPSSAQKIKELTETGRLSVLEDWVSKTPPGIIEMLNIKGLGPKKIHTIWKEMNIESLGELLYACQENRLKMFKGFGEKTQQNVIDSIRFYFQHKEQHLYAQVYPLLPHLQSFLEKILPDHRIELTGEMKRQMETVESIDYLIDADEQEIRKAMDTVTDCSFVAQRDQKLIYQSSLGVTVGIIPCTGSQFVSEQIKHSSSPAFLESLNHFLQAPVQAASEEEFFRLAGLQAIPSFAREHPSTLDLAKEGRMPTVVQFQDIRGIIHSHSQWSDGSQSIEEMAGAAMARGLEYLVISDHSKSAFYANGLTEDRVREQHRQIDELNARLAPFRIFKSIEADILNDGSLDYSDELLSTFDLVIASVHSNLKMTEEKAMMRVLKAIENPHTRILGHMTGRLLLSRPGYPLDMHSVIDACAEHGVVIELNANPSRLDIDWRYISYALSKNVLISINPDAHHTDGYDDNYFGVLVAQKALVTKEQNLSSFSLEAFTAFLSNRKRN